MNLKKSVLLMLMAFIFVIAFASKPNAEEKKYQNWYEVATDMEAVLRNALSIYQEKGADGAKEAKDEVNVAYFGFYEKIGFEKIVMSTISGARGSEVEHQFYLVKKAIRDSEPYETVEERTETLIRFLYEDAEALDGGKPEDNAGDENDGNALRQKREISLDEKGEPVYKDWTDVAFAMTEHLENALSIYEEKGAEGEKEAKDEVNVAYFGFYEKIGFEKIVMSTISGSRGSEVEHQFYLVKKAIRENQSYDEVKALMDTLIDFLYEDAKFLDEAKGVYYTEKTEASGKSEGLAGLDSGSNSIVAFLASFGLTMREGLEAILVVAALVAYLVKTDNKKYLKGVYMGAVAGIAFSAVLALVFVFISKSLGDVAGGAGQEIFEGVTMFIAVIVLFYVSNWMLSKSEAEVWNQYIQSQVSESISKGNILALAFSSFIAVAREGAELILFLMAGKSRYEDSPYQFWGGLIVAVVILVILYILITKIGVRLPLKPFFVATSTLMFVLCISFVGKGVKELQEADVIDRTVIKGMNGFSIDLLGIYDRLETLLPQIILLVITIITVIIQRNNNKKKLEEVRKASKEKE